MLPVILLITVFGLLMRLMTKSWGWYKKLLVTYFIFFALFFCVGSLDGPKQLSLALNIVNICAIMVVVYGGGLVVLLTAIGLLLGIGRYKDEPLTTIAEEVADDEVTK